MTPSLGEQAEEFARTLNTLFDAALGVPQAFSVIDPSGEGPPQRRIGVAPIGERGFSLMPLRRSVDDTDRLFLKVEFDLEMDQADRYLQVRKSVFGLWVNLTEKRKGPTPVFRLEYDRETTGGKPPAHVHLHAESVELGWIAGSAGQPLRSHSEIHFPVGGRRFRPTVEELLLFLDREKLFTDWASRDWKQVAQTSLEEFAHRQARATVRRRPEAAVAELKAQGYTVVAPGEADPH